MIELYIGSVIGSVVGLIDESDVGSNIGLIIGLTFEPVFIDINNNQNLIMPNQT